MDLITGKNGLWIPQQTKDQSELIDFTPAAIEAWRAKLPMANVGETAKKMYAILHEAHCVRLNPAERYQILELFHLPCQYVCQSLRKHYLGQTVMLSPKKRKVAALAQALQIEMATGYNIIIEQLADQKVSAAKNILPLAIHRAMSYFTHVLLRAYLLYAPEPNNIWQEMHLLYKIAEGHNIHKTDISEHEISMMCHNNILDVYKHALVLGVADSSRLQQCQVEQIHVALESWVNMVELKKYKADNDDLFIIDLDDCHAPQYQDFDNFIASPNCRTLDLRPLLKRIEKLKQKKEGQATLSFSSDDNPETHMTPCLLKHLLTNWTQKKVRRHKRNLERRPLTLSIGINATDFFLNEAVKASENHETDILADLDNEIHYDYAVKESKNSAKQDFASYSCFTLDVSNGGYCVGWNEDEPIPIFTGAILGIQEICDDGQTNWQIGTVRWIQQIPDQGLEFGVQLLAYHAQAAEAQVYRDGQPVGRPTPVILVPEATDQHHNITVITPALPFKNGDEVSIDDGENEFHCELTRLVNSSASFNQFEFTKLKGDHPGNNISDGNYEEVNFWGGV